MSAMSPESATSPQTKHTALSVAKTPDPSHFLRRPPITRKRTRSSPPAADAAADADDRDHAASDPAHPPPDANPDAAVRGWTDAHERALRRLCLDHTADYHPGHEDAFWKMIQVKMTDQFGTTVRSPAEVQQLDRMFSEQSLSRRRQWLLDWFQPDAKRTGADAAPPRPPNGYTAAAKANGTAAKVNGTRSPTSGSRKKRKTARSHEKASEEEAVSKAQPEPPTPAVPAVNGAHHDEATDDADADKPKLDFSLCDPLTVRTKQQDADTKQLWDATLAFLRENRVEEPSTQDDLMTAFDDMFTPITGKMYEFPPQLTIHFALVYMVYCLARDNRSRLLEVEEELEKEQKKRKWNDDVLWSMINNKCSEVSIRASEQVDQVMRMIKIDAGADLQQLRTDVVAAVTKYLRIQDAEDEAAPTGAPDPSDPDHPMDHLPPPATPPRREGLRTSNRATRPGNGVAKHPDQPAPHVNGTGRGDAASTAGSTGSRSRVAGFEAELDTALLAQQLKTLTAQREADAQTIEHQKLVILRMDQRLQDLESRVAGVA